MKRLSARRILLGLLGLAFVLYAAWIGPSACSFIQYVWNPDGIESSILDVDQGFKFPPGFPPDPGRAGKQDIEGIDSDQDGVRDDVQRWIYALVPNEPKKQMALRQLARHYQFHLHPEFGHEIRLEANHVLDRALDCKWLSFPEDSHGYIEFTHLEAKVLNTKLRTMRFLENDSKWTQDEISHEREKDQQPCDNR